LKKKSIKSLFISLKKKKAHAVIQKDIKKEFSVNRFDFFFFSVFLMDVMGGKITTSKITALK